MILLKAEEEAHSIFFGSNYIYNTRIVLFLQCFNFKFVKIVSITPQLFILQIVLFLLFFQLLLLVVFVLYLCSH